MICDVNYIYIYTYVQYNGSFNYHIKYNQNFKCERCFATPENVKLYPILIFFVPDFDMNIFKYVLIPTSAS